MNYQLQQTGDQVQEILNQAPTTEQNLQSEITRSTTKDEQLETAIGNEKTRAEGVESNLQTAIGNEVTRAEGAESNLQTAIANEKTRAELIEGGLRTDVDAIKAEIPTQASPENQLADKAFVNSSIATNTAEFKGTYNSLEDLQTQVQDANANDYAFVVSTDAAGNTVYNRYKYVEGTGWVFEYALNNSSFTSAQWAAIQSGITAALVAKLVGLPTATELATQMNQIIDSVTAENTRAEGIESGLRTDVNANAAAIVAEKNRAEGVEGTLSTAIGTEKGRAEGAETILQQNIDAEALARGNADTTLQGEIDTINGKIPSQATASNQLADKAFVNSSIATNTADFKGTYNSLQELEAVTANNNDYGFVVSTDAAGNTVYNRYKYVEGTGWVFEYALNNSSFTSAQWAAIQSGITAALVTKLTNLPDATGLAAMFAEKQNVLTFDTAPTQNSTNPVTSGGVYTALAAILALIPSDATALNQLADKAYVAAQILAATPAFKGQFTSLVDLQAVASPKDGDLGIVRTKDNDGKDVFTFYQYLNNQWNVYFSLSYHPQTKPATTGTTGDYPYNGMGRVELPMNIVEGVNTLTQSMIPTATGGNTIYVIKYDFVLGEDITVPANCVLEFDGGSISGAYTITGANTGVKAGLVKIFNTDVTLAGSWNVAEAYPEWFGAKGDGVTDDTNALQKTFDAFANVKLQKTYYINNCTISKNNTFVYGKGSIKSYFTSSTASIPWPGIVNIIADNVTIDGITVIGEGSALTDNTKNESCINAYGESSNETDSEGINIVTRWVKNLKVINCDFSNARCGVRVDFGKNISVCNCYIHDIGADGIEYLSVLDGNITDNHLVNFNLEHIYSNSYPIGMSKHYHHPNSQRIVVKGNIIENNPYWEGIDTHDGIDIVISENVLRNVDTGIACVSTGNIGSVQHCIITSNRIYGKGDSGNGGIVVTGYSGTFLTTNDNVVANNSIENCHSGINSYLVVDSIFDSNTIKNCVEGIALSSTVRCTVNNNNIYIDDAFSSGTKCGISISITSGEGVLAKSLLIQNNNIKVTGANYGILAYANLPAAGYRCICKNNSIVTERTAEEIAADTADGITRDYRLYGLDPSIIGTIGNVFISDLFNTITGSVGTLTIPANSEVVYLEVPNGFYNYVANKTNIEVSIERDLPNIIVSKVTQSGNNRILLYNPTSSPFTLYGTSFTLRFSNIGFKE